MAEDVEKVAPGAERQPLRTALSFVLPLLILTATWRILSQHDTSPMELQLLVVDANGHPLPPWRGWSLSSSLHALGFFDLDRALQLGLCLGVYALGLVSAGLLHLRRVRLALLAPALALYSLVPWFLPLEHGVIGLVGLLLFPLLVLVPRLFSRVSRVRLLFLSLPLGVLLAFGGPALAPGLAFVIGAFAASDERGRGVTSFVTLLIASCVAVLWTLLPGIEPLLLPDVFADLRSAPEFGHWWALLPAAALAVPSLFGLGGPARSPGFVRLGVLCAALVFAVFSRSTLVDLNRAYVQDRESLDRARQGLQIGFPWIVVNLPRHLRPQFALAVAPAQWPLVRSVGLFDTGEQVFLPEEFRFEEWLPTLRYTRRGVVATSWGELALFGAPPVCGRSAGEAARTVFARCSSSASSRTRPRVRSCRRCRPCRSSTTSESAPGCAWSWGSISKSPARLALLVPAYAASWHDGFSGSLLTHCASRSFLELSSCTGREGLELGLDRGAVRLVGHALGFGPIIEILPSGGALRGRVDLPPL